jgi:peptidoglycan DL-endopeptidase CwlO
MTRSGAFRRGLPVAAVALSLSVACASTSGLARPSAFPHAPRPGEDDAPDSPRAGASEALAVVRTALALQGIPYRLGGDAPESGFDCSGLVRYVFSQFGIDVPRTAAEQYGVGITVPLRDIQPGDLIFFSTVAPGASHVGIALGGGEFVHAPATNGVVRVERLDNSYWRARIVGARRLL